MNHKSEEQLESVRLESSSKTRVAIQDPELQKALGRLTTGMADADLRRFMYLMCVFELKRGDVLVREGEHTESLYIVQHGALRITVGSEPNVIELPEVNTGQWVGEVSLLDPGPASATVSVLRKTTTVLEFSHAALKDFARTNPAGAAALLEALASTLADRLHRTSDGLIRNRDGLLSQGEMPPPPEQTTWFKKVMSALGQRES